MDIHSILNIVDWEKFEDTVLQSFVLARDRYTSEHAGDTNVRVYQVAIWASAQDQLSTIGFETRSHAEAHLSKQLEFARENGFTNDVERLEKERLNGSPMDFLFPRFQVTEHPELGPLSRVDFDDEERTTEVDRSLERSLLRVKERILAGNLLSALPREPSVWFGISSPNDWYDHVTDVVVEAT
jgi:hypothetical protein